jgi:hypothetical protein
MARLNLTVPDPLYERLDRLRDRVNVSKICATALERELDMLEGQFRPFSNQMKAPTLESPSAESGAEPTPLDPRLQQLVQRLQGTRERWYQRGRQDGDQWAIESATREQLMSIAKETENWDGLRLMQGTHPSEFDRAIRATQGSHASGFAHTIKEFRLEEHLDRWLAEEAEVQEEVPTPQQQERIARARAGLDEAAYLQGWRDAVKETWQAVAPALR